MTLAQILAAISGGSTLILAISFVSYVFIVRKDSRADQKENTHLRDLLVKQDEALDEMTRDRDALMVQLASAKEDLRKEHALRTDTEAQRNKAFEEGVAYVVEKLKKSKIADVQRFTADLLAKPLPGWVPKAVPEGRATAPGPDALIDPFAVQPAKDP